MTATATVEATYELIERGRIHESPLNPRKHYDQAALEELAASIKKSGIITPLIVRPNGKGFETGAGHRRLRAAAIADYSPIPCVVRRGMTDEEFIELLNVENLQREDLTALEEADGYKTLMTKAGYDAKRIADRIGKSEKYVYDRIKLLQLIPAAKKLLEAGTITAGHGILLARLSPKDQERAMEVPEGFGRGGGGLLEDEQTLELEDVPEAQPFKARSVRELQGWIDKHIRFAAEPKAVDPMVFPEAAAALAAVKPKEKVIQITHEYHVDESARDDKERTWGPRSWERADGLHDSKTCEFSVLGVIVVGPGRGDAFKVCTQKEKCKTHWATWQKERAARARVSAQRGESAAVKRDQARHEREQRERQAAERAKQRYTKALPKILEAVAVAVKKSPAHATGDLADIIVKTIGRRRSSSDLVPRGRTSDDLVRYVAFSLVVEDAGDWAAYKDFPAIAKTLGVNVAKIIDAVEGVDKAAKKAKKK